MGLRCVQPHDKLGTRERHPVLDTVPVSRKPMCQTPQQFPGPSGFWAPVHAGATAARQGYPSTLNGHAGRAQIARAVGLGYNPSDSSDTGAGLNLTCRDTR